MLEVIPLLSKVITIPVVLITVLITLQLTLKTAGGLCNMSLHSPSPLLNCRLSALIKMPQNPFQLIRNIKLN